jgi:enoyl-CoA hydratase
MSTTTATAYETLKLERVGATAVVTINRPQALNALSSAVLADLRGAFHALEHDATVKGVVLTGEGAKAFVAGADIAQFTSLSYEEGVMFSRSGQQLFEYIEQFPKPVVAAINGFALGGGCELAMACHLRMAATNARFGQPEVNLGIIAGYGGTQRLPRLIGKTKALELLLTADMIGAEEAHRLGLVNHVVAPEELIQKSLELLEKIYTKGPLAVQYTLAAVNAGFEADKNGYEVEAVSFARAVVSEDGREGASAFLEKRVAKFTGR